MKYSALLLLLACTTRITFSQAVERLRVTRPNAPLTVQDTIVALAIREAILHGIPNFGPRQHDVIVERVPGVVSPHALPSLPSVAFYLLDSVQIVGLANQVGDFPFLRPDAARIDGDTATIGIISKLGPDVIPTSGRRYLSVGMCAWRAVRHLGAWTVDSLPLCGES